MACSISETEQALFTGIGVSHSTGSPEVECHTLLQLNKPCSLSEKELAIPSSTVFVLANSNDITWKPFLLGAMVLVMWMGPSLGWLSKNFG